MAIVSSESVPKWLLQLGLSGSPVKLSAVLIGLVHMSPVSLHVAWLLVLLRPGAALDGAVTGRA